MQGKTKKILIFLILLNIVAIVCFAFFFFSVRSRNESVARIENSISSELKKQEVRSAMRVLLADTAVDRKKLETFFLDKDKTIAFLEKLESLAKNNGLQTHVDAISENTDKQSLSSVKLTLRFEGGWSGAVNFLSQLETLPYHVNISNFNAKKDGVVKKAPIWNGSVSLEVIELTS